MAVLPAHDLALGLDRAADQGYELRIGAETLAQPCYDMRALTGNLEFVTKVSRAVNALEDP